MTVPAVEGLLTVPYVGVAEFRAAPTWLDSASLVQGGLQGAQDAELYNVLLRASSWAEGFCGQPLRAHLATEQCRARVDRWGRMFLHPSDNPVRSVTGIAYGPDFQMLTVLTDLTQTWVEDARGIVVSMIPQSGSFMGSLQFGPVPASGSSVFVQYQYVAGYANTYLIATANSGQNQLTVADPAGFQPPLATMFSTPIGASVARIWDPGSEEAITIGSSYVPGANPLVLASNLASTHNAGVQVSEIPAAARQAVVIYAVALLLRQDASTSGPFPGSPGPAARRAGGKGASGGLVEEAEQMLGPYRRVR